MAVSRRTLVLVVAGACGFLGMMPGEGWSDLAVPRPLCIKEVPLHGKLLPLGPTIEWRTNFYQASGEANEKKLPLFLLFGSNHSYTRNLDRELLHPTTHDLLSRRFVPVRLDHLVDHALSHKFQIVWVPTIIPTDHQGKILDRIEGSRDANWVHARMSQTLDKIQIVPKSGPK